MEPLGRRSVPSPADVERQLAEFWRGASTDEQVVMRACSMNLVVVCDDDPDDLRRATGLIARIAENVPGRALVVAPPGGAASELDVYVSAHCHRDAGGAQVCSEQVTIEPGPSSSDLVPGTVLQLLVEEMPVFTWWRRRELAASAILAPLVDLSDYWILDSATTGDPPAHLKAALALSTRRSWQGHLIDALWARLAPWREALASFFDDPARRPALARISRVEVAAGGRVAFAYLAGWLVSRLGFRPGDGGRWHRPDGASVELAFSPVGELSAGEVASARIEAEQEGSAVAFTARLAVDREHCLVLSVETDGRAQPPHGVPLPSLSEAETICGLLQRRGPDPVYDATLAAATRIV
jgi:glucose-6-phosphate dehydrogenase assembly protein OpcA